ncbi:ASCH/PUA domain-containing protein [Enterococcus mundtii]|uniref:DUF3850 domain-containing protein n=2 Tax=Enterococcus mundtii TaxID=53346 RepID=A0ABQ0VGW2_ENTMU|nr:ASCH/PUA domain-containing protein [Enterococcus mundtii]OJG59340.1 hypothetical protein RV08_GL001080 [Enterococcus mundtii]GEL81948.1 hypothetical protein EMU01_30920 [Enterococcus mundtii]GEN18545.1 hypothetical protein LAC02_18260 [Ligilactobacillus acidipiscis]
MSKQITIETLKKIISRNKNFFSDISFVLTQAGMDCGDIEPEEEEVLSKWCELIVSVALESVLSESMFTSNHQVINEHELKILPEYFGAITSGQKKFEIRKNDRDYKVGEQLLLREWNSEEFTGWAYKATITYVTDYAQKDGYVVLGIKGQEEVERL